MMPTISAEITMSDIRYARVIFACLDRDYTDAAPQMRVKITKEEARRLVRSFAENLIGRWDNGDDLTLIPGALWPAYSSANQVAGASSRDDHK